MPQWCVATQRHFFSSTYLNALVKLLPDKTTRDILLSGYCADFLFLSHPFFRSVIRNEKQEPITEAKQVVSSQLLPITRRGHLFDKNRTQQKILQIFLRAPLVCFLVPKNASRCSAIVKKGVLSMDSIRSSITRELQPDFPNCSQPVASWAITPFFMCQFDFSTSINISRD